MNEGNSSETFQGNDRVLDGVILGVVTFRLFAQTTLNIAPEMGHDLGLEANTMNIVVAIIAFIRIGDIQNGLFAWCCIRGGPHVQRPHGCRSGTFDHADHPPSKPRGLEVSERRGSALKTIVIGPGLNLERLDAMRGA